jgi:HEAT repeat protein
MLFESEFTSLSVLPLCASWFSFHHRDTADPTERAVNSDWMKPTSIILPRRICIGIGSRGLIAFMNRFRISALLILLLALPVHGSSVAVWALPCAAEDFARLVEKLKSQSSNERREAVEALGYLEDPRAIEPILTAFKDSSADVRAAAANATSEYKDKRAIEPLIALLKDGVAFVRSTAARVLGDLADAKAYEPLTLALGDENSSVRGASAISLGALKDQRAVDKLLSMIRDTGADVRSAVAASLGILKDKKASEALIHLLKDDDRMVRVSAAIALADIGDKQATPMLQEAIANEKNEEARMQMKEALQRLMNAN